MQHRQLIRQQYLAKRSKLSVEVCLQHGEKIKNIIVNQEFFIRARCLAFYMNFRQEVPLESLIQASWQYEKSCYLPLLTQQNQAIQFHLYHPGDSLLTNNYGILEPLAHTESITPNALDVVFLPLVAWDKHGNRLGMGAGFYDKCFAFLNHNTQQTRPCMVGIAHEIQYHKLIPAMPWDIPLQAVVTEKRIYTF